MSLETFPYGDHDLQTVTVARPFPAPASTGNDTGYWVMYFPSKSNQPLL